MLIHVPEPAAARVLDYGVVGEQGHVQVAFRDAAQRDAFTALLEKAMSEGYAIEVGLIHYRGHPTAPADRAARKAAKR